MKWPKRVVVFYVGGSRGFIIGSALDAATWPNDCRVYAPTPLAPKRKAKKKPKGSGK